VELAGTLVYTQTPLWVVFDALYRCVQIYITSLTLGERFLAKSAATKSLQELRTVSANTWCATFIERNIWASCWAGTKEEEEKKKKKKEEGEKRMAQLTCKQTTRDSRDFHVILLKFQFIRFSRNSTEISTFQIFTLFY